MSGTSSTVMTMTLESVFAAVCAPGLVACADLAGWPSRRTHRRSLGAACRGPGYSARVAWSGFRLGVDFGTSHTVAALADPDGRIRSLLFDGSPLLASAVAVGPGAELLVGLTPCAPRWGIRQRWNRTRSGVSMTTRCGWQDHAGYLG
jgi:hypothetical protein